MVGSKQDGNSYSCLSINSMQVVSVLFDLSILLRHFALLKITCNVGQDVHDATRVCMGPRFITA